MDNEEYEGKDQMKLCVFADVHGNMDAFNRMLDVEQEVADLFIFAGDIFGYFHAQPEIIDRLMSMSNLVAVKGNHEKYYLSGMENEALVERYGSSYQLSLNQAQRKYIELLPESAQVQVGEKMIGIFHGGPQDYLEQRVYPDSDLEIDRMDQKYDYLILAHTHYQLYRTIDRIRVINPGSLGQPRDGKGFSYCLVDTELDTCTFKTVEVDVADLLQQVKEKDANRYVCEYLIKKYKRTNR